MRPTLLAVCLSVWLVLSCVVCAEEPKAPLGFRAIFNGSDLTDWYGFNPHSIAQLDRDERQAALGKMRDEFAEHWRVEDGELVTDGKGPFASAEIGPPAVACAAKLVPLLFDPDEHVRGNAARAIAYIDLPADFPTAELKRAANSSDRTVQLWTESALRKIESKK